MKTDALGDNGCSGQVVSEAYVRSHRLDTIRVDKPAKLRLADGRVVGAMNTMARVKHWIGDHISEDWFWVTSLLGYDLIVGQPWLELHDPQTSWAKRTFTFNSDYCIGNCLSHGLPVILTCHKDGHSSVSTVSPQPDNDVEVISAYAAVAMMRNHPEDAYWVFPEHWEALDASNDLYTTFVNVFAADATSVTPQDFEKFHSKLNTRNYSEEELKRKVPKAFHHILDLWDPKEAAELPPNRPGIDHEIRLIDGATPPHKRPYGGSREEMEAIRAYVYKELKKGYVKESSSPYAAPLLVVRKPGGGLRICVDYRQLNALTIKNRNIPPNIRETLARFNKVRIFSKFDIVAAFNKILVKEGDREKTAFLTRFGLFEYVVMPFGLCNAPGTFQRYINSALRDYLDDFCSAYLDDVIVYSEREEDHEEHCLKVLTKLRKAGLYLDINKCEFSVRKVKYLGLILTTEGLQMDPDKVKAVLDWKDLRTVKDVQAFIGFANFYRRFIYKFSTIVAPLLNVVKETTTGNKITFDGPARTAFERLKQAFTEAPVLVHFDPELKTYVETDASDWIVSGIMSQMHDGVLKPVAYFSMKMKPAETNYPIYDKELLAIIKAFEEWKPELAGTADPIEIFSDHKALEYFMTTKQLNRRQARWAEFLSEFNFIIKYRPGKQGTKPDSLTRRPGDIPDGIDDDRLQHQMQTVIKPHQVEIKSKLDGGSRCAIHLAHILLDELEMEVTDLAVAIYLLSEEDDVSEETLEELLAPALLEEDEEPDMDNPDRERRSPGPEVSMDDPQVVAKDGDIVSRIRTATKNDDTLQRIIDSMKKGHRRIPYELFKQGIRLELGNCRYEDGLLYVKRKIFVPYDDALRTELVRTHHESLPAGHGGKHATFARLSRHYFWPFSTDAVARYVRNCYTCLRSKPYKEGKSGLLNPLPIPNTYWTSISVDFVTPLPECKFYDRTYKHLMVVVDRLSKKKKFVPLTSLEVDAVVQGFIEHIWREEGYPVEIVSDRGTQFVAHFWKRLCERIGTHPKLSTTAHPETDGQTEIANAAVKQYLRAYVHYSQKDWAKFLPFAEFQANSDRSQSSGLAPFEATKGYLPRSGLEPSTAIPQAGWKATRDIKAADQLIDRIKNLQEFLKWNLAWAQEKMKQQADSSRHPAPAFQVGDWVMLDARNIKTEKQSRGLDQKNVGPYRIVRNIDNKAYELDLKGDLRGIFPVFHPWLLHLDPRDPLPEQRRKPQGPVNVDDDGTPVYEVEEILDSRIDARALDRHAGQRKKGLLYYLVKWEGWEKPTWQPYNDLVGCEESVYQYHQRNPNAVGPHRTFKYLPAQHEELALLFLSSCQAGTCGNRDY